MKPIPKKIYITQVLLIPQHQREPNAVPRPPASPQAERELGVGVRREGNASQSSSSFLSLAPKVRASPFPLPSPWDVKVRQLLSPSWKLREAPNAHMSQSPKCFMKKIRL